MTSVRRLLAFAVDWIVIVFWGGAVFGAVMIATGGRPPRPGGPWVAQGIGFVTMTLPVLLYFTFLESSSIRGSVGKRTLGLIVSHEAGGRLSFGSAFLRNAIKFTPWELGHTVAQQAAYSGEAGVPAWIWGPMSIACGGPVWWVASMFATGRTPYDRLASARVDSAADAP